MTPTWGPTKNFEKASFIAEGDIIVLSDWDEVWIREKLERVERGFETSRDVGLVLSDAQLVDETLTSMGRTLWEVPGVFALSTGCS